MTHDIIKFNSGFYGLRVISTNEFYRTDLIKWDGKRGTNYPYSVDSENFEFYINADNTVYYTDKGGANARVWCSGRNLNAHCHHLAQIRARA